MTKGRGNGPFPVFTTIARAGNEAFPGGNVPFPASFKTRRVGKEAFPRPYIPAFFIPVSRSAIFFETLPPFRLS